MDNYLRQRAQGSGAVLYNGLFLRMEQKQGPEGPFTIDFSNYEEGGKVRAAGLPLKFKPSARIYEGTRAVSNHCYYVTRASTRIHEMTFHMCSKRVAAGCLPRLCL